MNLSNLTTRTISGLVYMGLIIAGICINEWTFFALVLLLAVLASLEFSSMTQGLSNDRMPYVLLDLAGVLSLTLSVWLFPVVIWFVVMGLRLLITIYDRSENPLRALALSCLSQIWIGLPLGFMYMLGFNYDSCGLGQRLMVLAVFIIIWVNDTGAYLVGSALGKHRLFERLSPKKSWEGFWGGFFFSVIAALIMGVFFSNFFTSGGYAEGFSLFDMSDNLILWVILGVVVCVAGTFGDLFESLIKRSLHLKDSSHLIPGHGGILDRIDSVLFAIPAFFLFLLIQYICQFS